MPIDPAVSSHDEQGAKVALSFGPEAIVLPTKDQTGFTVLILRGPAGPFSVPILKARVTFDAAVKPVIEMLEVTNES